LGNTALEVVSLGFLGSDDGCQLDIPYYVAWARGDTSDASSLIGHETGHTLGLVGPRAPHGEWADNFSHSVNDELDGGECGGDGVTYNENKTLYRQPGVTGPVVNPLAQLQLYPTCRVASTRRAARPS